MVTPTWKVRSLLSIRHTSRQTRQQSHLANLGFLREQSVHNFRQSTSQAALSAGAAVPSESWILLSGWTVVFCRQDGQETQAGIHPAARHDGSPGRCDGASPCSGKSQQLWLGEERWMHGRVGHTLPQTPTKRTERRKVAEGSKSVHIRKQDDETGTPS